MRIGKEEFCRTLFKKYDGLPYPMIYDAIEDLGWIILDRAELQQFVSKETTSCCLLTERSMGSECPLRKEILGEEASENEDVYCEGK